MTGAGSLPGALPGASSLLVDSHCHLHFDPLAADLDGVVARAQNAGVGVMVNVCTTLAGFAGVLAVAERFDGIYASVGVHPHESGGETADADHLVALADHRQVVAIGETGLDYHYDHAPREAQQRSFRAHIRAARASSLPLIVHARNADDDVARILEEEAGQGAFAGVLHCFSSGPALAERALALGFYVSLSGILTFRNAAGLRAIVRTLPVDRLLVETDAPYLAPEPHRGKTNEPSFLPRTVARLAEELGLSPEETTRRTTENFFRLFTQAQPF